MVWSAILGPVIAGIFSVIDKAIEDKDQAAAIKVKLQEMVLTGQMREIEEAAANIRAEATGDSWLQRSWRPLTMLTFVSLIVAKWLGFTAPGVTEAVELALFEIIKVGLGGYVIGRSVEKGIRVWKEK
ncbi:MAG: 3TM-type holin [Pseudomonadota bacterium]